MNLVTKILLLLVLSFGGALARAQIAGAGSLPSPLAWPKPSLEAKPWTRWWWLGSAVDATNLTRILTEFRDAGIGGVEICPIYGAKGFEDHYLDFLSPKWMEMLAHTTREAKRLGLGVDVTTGTGWPFGGPRVTAEDASARVQMQRYSLVEGGSLKSALPKGRLQCLMAVSDSGPPTNLTARVHDGQLDWVAPAGAWKLYAISLDGPVMKVKRAAPGGVGNVLDPYSTQALNRYLADFDKAFANYRGETPRSQFHDSFEYYNAQWTPDLFTEFMARRGYDLRTHLPALFGEGDPDVVARAKGDYRETISDLHLAYVRRWTEWSHAHGSLTRNQAHGAPGNLLDLYAAVDIPETELFGGTDEKAIPMLKLASSAAHVTGRKLSSSESFTWLNEHFQTTLSDVKQAADYLFLSGVNHIFFHGIPYSPGAAPWPGWQFYAAVNFGPQGGLWRDLPEFNAYVARVQSELQSGTSDNDVLLYFPLHDLFQKPDGLLIPLTVHNVEKELAPHPFYQAALTLGEGGFGYDHVSDRVLDEATCEAGRVVLGGNKYRAVLVPRCRVMPTETLAKLLALARDGATIVFQGAVPSDVPGLGQLVERRAKLKTVSSALKFATNREWQRAVIGQGSVLLGDDVASLLRTAGVPREAGVDAGLRFVRRAHPEGHSYFLANRSERAVDGWVKLGVFAKSATILDPRFANRSGVAALQQNKGATFIHLQIAPGESRVVRTFADKLVEGPAWPGVEPAGEPQILAGIWKVQFLDGGPVQPASFATRDLGSWTQLGGKDAERFAGTARYTIEFQRPAGQAEDWLLELGRVAESARVRLNGSDVGALWCAPFRISVGKFLRPGKNTLEVEVTNLAANRIRDLDQRQVGWKYFHDANLASKHAKSLDASNWPVRDSGLLGPVRLIPMKSLQP